MVLPVVPPLIRNRFVVVIYESLALPATTTLQICASNVQAIDPIVAKQMDRVLLVKQRVPAQPIALLT